MITYIRRRLGLKLFLSYLIVILVGSLVLSSAAELAVPGAFNRHLAAMDDMMASMMGGTSMEMDMDLYANFQAAFREALGLSALAALLVALVVSLLVSRQVVAPVQAMRRASGRIAEGHYSERVQVPGDLARAEQDELGQLALSFNRMAERLEQTENMRRQLIADVAHELRTPLAAIKGTMEGLVDGMLPADLETFQQVYQEADRLGRLVNDLQELSRVEAGAYRLDRQPVSVGRLFESLLARLGRQFEEKGVSLEIHLPSGLEKGTSGGGQPAALVDEDRIGQVLLNLVGNALQFTPPGGRVAINILQREHELQIAVADAGIGIPPEHLPHIFDRFYRVDRSRARPGGGSGIGLTISRHLVEAHGGRMWAESPGTGQGSTFYFTLPLAAENR